MSAFKRLMKDERLSARERIEYWEKFHSDLEAERKAAAKRHGHKSSFWAAAMLIAGCIGIGYVIGAVWGNV